MLGRRTESLPTTAYTNPILSSLTLLLRLLLSGRDSVCIKDSRIRSNSTIILGKPKRCYRQCLKIITYYHVEFFIMNIVVIQTLF